VRVDSSTSGRQGGSERVAPGRLRFGSRSRRATPRGPKMTGRFSLVAGSPTQWAAVLRLMYSNAALSRAELNQLLDTLALSLDARREPPRSIASVRAHLPCVIVRAKSLDHPAPPDRARPLC